MSHFVKFHGGVRPFKSESLFHKLVIVFPSTLLSIVCVLTRHEFPVPSGDVTDGAERRENNASGGCRI